MRRCLMPPRRRSAFPDQLAPMGQRRRDLSFVTVLSGGGAIPAAFDRMPALMAGKRVAIVQSNYIPWKGYFDLINSVDEFVLFDDVQYTRRDWRNRNLIKTPHGKAWLTIPVQVKGQVLAPVKAIEVNEPGWGTTHWRTICANYARAPHFKRYAELLEQVYRDCAAETRLSAINHRFITALCGVLEIGTALTWSSDYTLCDGKTDRLVTICKQAGAATYVSGPNARAYMEPERFAEAGIELVYFDYDGYPEYPQFHPPFDHFVSLLDLIFNTGSDARRHMLSF
jgi:hypothetical protein